MHSIIKIVASHEIRSNATESVYQLQVYNIVFASSMISFIVYIIAILSEERRFFSPLL